MAVPSFLNNDVINVENLVSGIEARCFAVFPDGRRFNMGNFISLEATQDFKKSKAPILGNPGGGNRKGAPTNKITGKVHYNNSLFRRFAQEYQRMRKDLYFDMVIVNDDPTSTVGTQRVILHGVNMDSTVITKFDAESEFLTEDFSATFESWELDTEFNNTGVREA